MIRNATFAVIAATFALSSVTMSSVARADDTSVCISAHHDAQTNRAEHHLVTAHKQLLLCSESRCPQLIGMDCRKWAAEVEGLIPTVVIDVRDEKSAPVLGATLSVDGSPAVQVDGRALEIDPGEHVFRLETSTKKTLEWRGVVLEGQRAQKLTATIRGANEDHVAFPGEPPSERKNRPIPTASIALGAVGIVGLGLATGFGISGLGRKSNLDNQNCKPSCSSKDVDSTQRDFLVADISLGVGVVSLAVATILLITNSGETPSEPKSARASRPSQVSPFAFQF